jgi:hypothetical protein
MSGMTGDKAFVSSLGLLMMTAKAE